MSLVSLCFVGLTHACCLRSASQTLCAVWWTLPSTSFRCAACKLDAGIDFLLPFHNYVCSLFTHPPPSLRLLLSRLSYLPCSFALLYFSNSFAPIHFYASVFGYSLSQLYFLPVWSPLLNFPSHRRHCAAFPLVSLLSLIVVSAFMPCVLCSTPLSIH